MKTNGKFQLPLQTVEKYGENDLHISGTVEYVDAMNMDKENLIQINGNLTP